MFKHFYILIYLFFFSVSVFATSFTAKPFEQRVDEAHFVVRGYVGMTYSDWSLSQKGKKRIYTFTEVLTKEVLKGDVSSNSVMLRSLGGMKDGVGVMVHGVAKFKRGEDVVVFMGKQNSDESYSIRGMMMGKYQVVQQGGDEVLKGPGIGGPSQHHVHRLKSHDDTNGKKEPKLKWTTGELKQLIASQTVNNKGVSPVVVDADVPASQLQNSKSEAFVSMEETKEDESDNQYFFYGWLFIGIVFTGIFMALFFWRIRKN